jgi:anti-anti-sigma factor
VKLTPAHLRFEPDPGLPVAVIQGEIDLSNADDLGQRLLPEVPAGGLGLVVDLSHATYLDSSGVRMLFELARRLEARGQRLRLAVPHGAVIRRLLDLVQIGQLAVVASDVAAARAADGELA